MSPKRQWTLARSQSASAGTSVACDSSPFNKMDSASCNLSSSKQLLAYRKFVEGWKVPDKKEGKNGSRKAKQERK